MKTFETEKHNIPEGATHYSEEEVGNYSTWFRVGDTVEFFSELTGKWQLVGAHISCLKYKVTPIPKPETTEWNGEGLPPVGVECEAKSGALKDWFKGEVVAHDGEFAVLRMHDDYPFSAVYAGFGESRLRKLESPQQKLERERLGSAYDLYSSWVSNSYGEPLFCFKAFCDAPDLCTKWLAIVDKTNYRKGE